MLVRGNNMKQLIEPNQSTTFSKTVDIAQRHNPLQPVSDALERIFTTQQEENRIQKTRRIMGNLVNELSDEDLEVFITEFQYLLDEWLDGFEQQAFDGQTLKQVLGEG
jgi:hypothetical protein